MTHFLTCKMGGIIVPILSIKGMNGETSMGYLAKRGKEILGIKMY